MPVPGVTRDEFRQIAHACRVVLIDRLPERIDLRTFLVAVLQPSRPELARRVGELNDNQMRGLHRALAEQQRLTV
jgi:hypothetical protein